MNSVILIGRLTKDPEIAYLDSGTAVGKFILAVDRIVKSGNERQADFIRITAFGKQAVNCAKFITKGKQVAVEGRIQTGSYQNKNGDTVYTTDVIANRVEFLSGGRAQNQQSPPSASQGSYNPRASQDNQQVSMGSLPPNFDAIDDDDVPF